MLYLALKRVIGVFFNILNFCLRGNLPPFGCVCILVENEDCLLVIEQPNGKIAFPGGFMRWNEHPEQTLIREGKEETGLNLQPGSILGCQSLVSRYIDSMSNLVLLYQATIIDGELHSSVEGRPYWLRKADLPIDLATFYRAVLNNHHRYAITES